MLQSQVVKKPTSVCLWIVIIQEIRYLTDQLIYGVSVFSNEFVAMEQGLDALRGLRYKLRMLGVSISGNS